MHRGEANPLAHEKAPLSLQRRGFFMPATFHWNDKITLVGASLLAKAGCQMLMC